MDVLESLAETVSLRIGSDDWACRPREKVFRECVHTAIGHAYELAELQRDNLGMLVRSIMLKWENESPKTKVTTTELYRIIGEQMFLATLLSVASYFGSPEFDKAKK